MAATPTAPQNDVTLGHSYDGIREYDNPLPGWWTWLFIITVVISPIYILYFHVGAEGRSLEDQYLAAMDANTRKKYKKIRDLTPDSKTI
jgi:cytochrome c oxidase cbb3-type subunit 3